MQKNSNKYFFIKLGCLRNPCYRVHNVVECYEIEINTRCCSTFAEAPTIVYFDFSMKNIKHTNNSAIWFRLSL
ncbi:MAG: hypothetical protein DID92_2727744747 [Candidatus Nitrotoga sp. SPKER]|nr:MAG: hypothetical protein DID92_2727744747 [Candidatus Nitrotoga sp. SPKER]